MAQQLLALTNVTDDIFIANEKGVIVQGTLPQSIGQGFGTAYVTYPNGSLETFNPNGTRDNDGVITGDEKKIQARQFLMYILRPITRPRGWFLGASHRSEGITKLFAGANLGVQGVVGLVDLKRGSLQAIVGSSAQYAAMDFGDFDLVDQMRKDNAGIWAGPSPTDGVPLIIGYQRIADRPMAVIVGISAEEADAPVSGLAATARSLATVASIIVVVVAGMLVWGIATAKAVKLRQRLQQRTEMNLTNARQEIALSRARQALTEAEVGTLMSSHVDGVARVDVEQRLRLWNPRFAELACVPLGLSEAGMPIEDLLRQQAKAGVFGDEAEADDEVSKRLTALHTQGSWASFRHRNSGRAARRSRCMCAACSTAARSSSWPAPRTRNSRHFRRCLASSPRLNPRPPTKRPSGRRGPFVQHPIRTADWSALRGPIPDLRQSAQRFWARWCQTDRRAPSCWPSYRPSCRPSFRPSCRRRSASTS